MKRFVAENVCVSIVGRAIVNNGTVSIEKERITGLLGRNGSGKSTLLKAIFGTQKADDLNVHADGQIVRKPYAVRGLINYLPQWNFLPGDLQIKRILQQYEINPEKIVNVFPELEEDLTKKTTELSGGRERLWSTLSLVYADTKYTMLDEPFTHLAPLHIEKLKEILQREKHNKGILITDHMYQHLLELSDVLYLMKDGNSILIRERSDLVLYAYVKSL